MAGGYAVAYYGYPRATAGLDVWIGTDPGNAEKIVEALREIGFGVEALTTQIFLEENQVIRLGVPPLRLEILVTIPGVTFPDCYSRRVRDVLDGVEVSLISLPDLKANKAASGRPKGLDELQHLGDVKSGGGQARP